MAAPVENFTDLPEAGINVMDDVGSEAVGLLSTLEYHDAVLARLLTVSYTHLCLRSLVHEKRGYRDSMENHGSHLVS